MAGRPNPSCPDCARPLTGLNRTGYCWRCMRKRRCIICLEYGLEGPRRAYCEECRAVLERLAWVAQSLLACRARLPRGQLRRRINCYRQRASLGLPLFED